MPLDLHQRLSEFSYGYAVTRQVERLFVDLGFQAVPFLPNLIHEADLGFDVAFDRPGIPLFLQFKLGEVLQRFRKSVLIPVCPAISRPFWRFSIETSEKGGQYDLLLNAERGGAEVYYVAPKFGNWSRFAAIYQDDLVLENSVIISPKHIEDELAIRGIPDGHHKILYDRWRSYVCSEPLPIQSVSTRDLVQLIAGRIRDQSRPMSRVIAETFESMQAPRKVRRETEVGIVSTDLSSDEFLVAGAEERDRQFSRIRDARIQRLQTKARSEDDLLFASIGLEAWAVGAQLISVTLA